MHEEATTSNLGYLEWWIFIHGFEQFGTFGMEEGGVVA
jgi:hypothetical protein